MITPLLAALILSAAGDSPASLAMKPIDCFPAALCTGNVGSPGRRVEAWVESALLRQSRGKLNVTTPSNVLALLKESGMSSTEARQSCQDDECVKEIMGALDIEYLLGVEFYTVGKGFEISLKLWSGERSLATEMVSADSINELRPKLTPVIANVLSAIFTPDAPVTLMVPATEQAAALAKEKELAEERARQERLAKEAERERRTAEAERRRALAEKAKRREAEEAKKRRKLAEAAKRQAKKQELPGFAFASRIRKNFGTVHRLGKGAGLVLENARFIREKNGSISVGVHVTLISHKKRQTVFPLNSFSLLDYRKKPKKPRAVVAATIESKDPNLLKGGPVQAGGKITGWLVFLGVHPKAKDLTLSFRPKWRRKKPTFLLRIANDVSGEGQKSAPRAKHRPRVDTHRPGADKVAVLTILNGKHRGQRVELSGEQTSLGRNDDNDITLTDSKVSRQHARITRDKAGNYRVFDLGSTNGTTLNGSAIKEGRLRHADQLLFGNVQAKIEFPDRRLKDARPAKREKRKARREKRRERKKAKRKAVKPPKKKSGKPTGVGNTRAKVQPPAKKPAAKQGAKKYPWTLLFPLAPRHNYGGLQITGIGPHKILIGPEGNRWETEMTAPLAPALTAQWKIGERASLYAVLGGEVSGGIAYRKPLVEFDLEMGWSFPIGGAIRGFSKASLSTDVWRFKKSVLRCGVHSRAQLHTFRRHIGDFRQSPGNLHQSHAETPEAFVEGNLGGLGGGGSCHLFFGRWGVSVEGYGIAGKGNITGEAWLGDAKTSNVEGSSAGFMFRYFLLKHDGFL